MIKCNNCGSVLPDNAKFCTNCGAEITAATSTPLKESLESTVESAAKGVKSAVEQTIRAPGGTVRSIPISIILSIVTCGIYGIWWVCQLNREVNEAAGKRDYLGGVAVILLSIVTCSIYFLYWAYKMGTNVESIRQQRGKPGGSSPIIYLVLSFFGLSIVALAIMQSELNDLYLGQ